MQEIAPGGFQIMWKPSAVSSTANPATSSSIFRRKNEHPMKIMTTFAESQYTMTIMSPINPSHLLSAARAEFAVRGGYNILINNVLRNKGDVVTDAACFRIRRSEIN